MTRAPALRSLDPRAPLVLDTRELGRRPGSMRRLARTVPAPGQLGTEMIFVPAGAPVELRLRLEAVMEGVLVSGTVRAPLSGECARCLDAFAAELEVELQELYVYPDCAPDDDEALRLEGDLLDLEPALRDAIVVDLPLAPTCREECPGLCATCGERLAELPAGHAHDVLDPRWAALAKLGDRAESLDRRPDDGHDDLEA